MTCRGTSTRNLLPKPANTIMGASSIVLGAVLIAVHDNLDHIFEYMRKKVANSYSHKHLIEQKMLSVDWDIKDHEPPPLPQHWRLKRESHCRGRSSSTTTTTRVWKGNIRLETLLGLPGPEVSRNASSSSSCTSPCSPVTQPWLKFMASRFQIA